MRRSQPHLSSQRPIPTLQLPQLEPKFILAVYTLLYRLFEYIVSFNNSHIYQKPILTAKAEAGKIPPPLAPAPPLPILPPPSGLGVIP